MQPPFQPDPNMRVRHRGAPMFGGCHASQEKTPEERQGRLPALQAAQGEWLLRQA
jgi:hypothetical protein